MYVCSVPREQSRTKEINRFWRAIVLLSRFILARPSVVWCTARERELGTFRTSDNAKT